MWIFKNSKEILEHLQSPYFIHSIKSSDFPLNYTTIPHQKLKSRWLLSIIRNSFISKNVNLIYKYFVSGHEEAYFVKKHSGFKNKSSEDGITKILEFLVDKMFVVLRERYLTVGNPIGALFLAEIFLYSYKTEFT